MSGHVEAQRKVGVFADPDAWAADNALRRRRRTGEPEARFGGAEIPTVPFFFDRKSTGEAPGAASEAAVGDAGPAGAHDLESERGFERAQENPAPHARGSCADVEQEMDSVRPVHVRVPAFEEQGGVSFRRATVRVAGPISGEIGLDLHDPARAPSFGTIVDEKAAQKKAGLVERVLGKIRPREAQERLARLRPVARRAVHALMCVGSQS
jgi:hypothetical protein